MDNLNQGAFSPQNIQKPQSNLEVKNKGEVTPKDFFLNVGVMVSLYWLVISYILLVFQIIDSLLPDQTFSIYQRELSTFTMSSIIILTPLFLALNHLTNKSIRNNPAQRDIWVRKWLIYVTLFFSGVTIIIDVIVLLNTYLNGELTTRFITKGAVLIIIPLFVFWYLLSSLKRDYSDAQTKGAQKTLAIALIAIVVLTILYAFSVVGNPVQRRSEKIDDQRINDLRGIQSQIGEYYRTKNTLPESLDDLSDPFIGYSVPKDPETNQDYGYSPEQNGLSFELCADFKLERDYSKNKPESFYYYSVGDYELWNHGKGRECFERELDPERLDLNIAPKIPIR